MQHAHRIAYIYGMAQYRTRAHIYTLWLRVPPEAIDNIFEVDTACHSGISSFLYKTKGVIGANRLIVARCTAAIPSSTNVLCVIIAVCMRVGQSEVHDGCTWRSL